MDKSCFDHGLVSGSQWQRWVFSPPHINPYPANSEQAASYAEGYFDGYFGELVFEFQQPQLLSPAQNVEL